MNTPPLLKTGWWSFALPGYRDHPSPTTYSLFSYEDLPPLEVPKDGTLRWLQSKPPHQDWSLAANGYSDGTKPDLGRLPELMAQAQVGVPAAFITFMQTPSLHERIRSCTACYLELSDYAVQASSPAKGTLIHFLSDQQWCLHWYLYAARSGAHCVAVSGEAYGFDFDPAEPRLDGIDLVSEDIWLCAPTFVDFIYRYWLENEIFFSLAQGEGPLTSEQQAYVNHYRRTE